MIFEKIQIFSNSLLITIEFWVNVYAVILSIVSIAITLSRFTKLRRTHHLRKVWGIKDKDYVIVVCSELDDPEERQNVEPREFIYNLKYGDVDAYFEVVITLLRLFPKIKLQVMSCGEAENTRMDFGSHLVLIGGPDYNTFTERVLEKKITQFYYRSPYADEYSKMNPDEIVLYDSQKKVEYCELSEEKDFGYFERVFNPNNPEKSIILIGGCHTIGVTGSIKAFSMFESEQGEIPKIVMSNAKKLSKKISRKSEFSVLLPVERVGQTINTPMVKNEMITIKKQ